MRSSVSYSVELFKVMTVCAVVLFGRFVFADQSQALNEGTAQQSQAVNREDSKVLTNSVGMKLVWIPAGEFMMGSSEDDKFAEPYERPQHKVRLTNGFWMGTTEVTQAQYEAVMGENPGKPKGQNLPITGVSFKDAMEFCERLSEAENRNYSLPTEAQWEYACRGGNSDGQQVSADLGERAWYRENSNMKMHAVAQKKANAFGLHDMLGNVSEMCLDLYDEEYYSRSPEEDPKGPAPVSTEEKEGEMVGGVERVLRGGLYLSSADRCRCAARYAYDSIIPSQWDGFRVVINSKPAQFEVRTNSMGMEFVRIPAGEFMMGSSLSPEEVENEYGGRASEFRDEHPKHKVRISKGFWLSKHEVTQEQYTELMDSNPSLCKYKCPDCDACLDAENVKPTADNWRVKNHPVDGVRFADAVDFSKKLSEKDGQKYSLPTEAQWEYACRAGTETVYFFGDDSERLDEFAWYRENSETGTKEVGTKKPNPWGLHDMYGNVSEWCLDAYDPDCYSNAEAVDPVCISEDMNVRVVRGGIIGSLAQGCRSASREPAAADEAGFVLLTGIRLVCENWDEAGGE
ncbi:formylglycine-generating enzyme family protein [Anaerohalosphaera lusitana]|nr:formylglycine-generating enzyme family protein [Anaerohalosphaera lusitana]